ncbi:MAG TPA: Kdo hydroxylase family protein [Bryobacteraceae bacterium]|nr:Kdo hydroxylase family protein [Bryobacteraceae bacterium]
MQAIEEIGITSWRETAPRMAEALEIGKVVLAPRLHFELPEPERRFLSPACLDGKSKNVSYRPATGALGGASPDADRAALTAMLKRYFERTSALLEALCPEYCGKLSPGFTSFRPAEIAGRATSWRKDDTRLHVDAFPSRPLRGLRIIRVFSNVNPAAPRMWRVGDAFENVARTFLPKIAKASPVSAWLLHILRITKTRRTPYDHLMLGIHDAMKADERYQRECPQVSIAIPPGATWMCFTDSVPHAAMSGQFALEQTFYLPVEAMRDPSRSPLRILERLTGKALLT